MSCASSRSPSCVEFFPSWLRSLWPPAPSRPPRRRTAAAGPTRPRLRPGQPHRRRLSQRSRELEIDDLSRRFFTASENQKLASFPADRRKEAFLRCWTCKDAFIQAVGKGVSLGLDTFAVSLGVGNPEADVSSAIDSFVVDTCSLIPLTSSALEGYFSALAIDGEEAKVSIRSWVRSV